MKLYPFALSLILSISVAAQTIPYELGVIDMEAEPGNTRILELAPIGSKVYWAVENDVNYLSNGSAESTLSFRGGVGLRHGIKALGNVGSDYYFHYEEDGERYNVVVNVVVPIPKLVEYEIFEDQSFKKSEPVLVGDKLYTLFTQDNEAPARDFVYLIETDLTDNSSTIVSGDTVENYGSIGMDHELGTDGETIYYTRPQNGDPGPAAYDIATGTVTDLATFRKSTMITYERLGDRVLMHHDIPEMVHTRVYFLTPTALGRQLDGVPVVGQSVALDDQLVSVDTAGYLIATDYTDGRAEILDEIGTKVHGAPRLFALSDTALIYYSETATGWQIGLSDGTQAGTRAAVDVPRVANGGPSHTVRLGAYVALTSANQPVYLFDPRGSDDLQRIDADFNLAGGDPPLAVAGDRLYFAAIHPEFGEELHHVTIDSNRVLSGVAFNDLDEDGVQGEGEQGIANVLIRLTDTDQEWARTDSAGRFRLAVIDGETYTLDAQAPDCYALTQGSSERTVTVPTDPHKNIPFGYRLTDDAASLALQLSAGRVRCNAETPFWLTVRNDGCVPLAGGTATFEMPRGATFVSVSRDSAVQQDTTLTFTFGELAPGEAYHNVIKLKMPNEAFAGDTLVFGGNAGALSDDESATATDTVSLSEELRCAIDPNDKQVWPRRPEPSNSNYTLMSEPLEYRIRFQNFGNDTAFAVRIEDQLSDHLDPATLVPGESSHPYDSKLDEWGKLIITFPGIELVDSMTNPAASQGFVDFTVMAREDLPEQTVVKNKAGIYFDFNKPVITNTVASTLVSVLDADQDGFNFYADCDDTDAAINPKAEEIADNEVDENCDGEKAFTTGVVDVLPGRLKVYPNPVRHRLTVSYSEGNTLSATLVDATGRVVMQRSFRGEVTLPVSGLAAGVYTLRVVDVATGGVASRRMVR